MTETVYFRQIGKEDLKIGRGTFEVRLADDRTVTLTEIFLPDYAEDSGTTDSYAVTISGLPNPYIAGQLIFFKANTANTGAATLNVNSQGAKTIKKHYNTDLADNDILASQIVAVIYDGTNFQMLNHTGNFLVDRLATEIYAADAGGSDAYAITLTPAPTAYVTGMVVNFKANTANTSAATLNVNSLGAKTIKKNVADDLETGDIKVDQISTVIYDGTNFQLISFPSNLASLTGDNSAGWPSFAVYLGTTQNNITSAQKLQLDTEEFDTNSDYDAATNYRFLPTVAGKYLLTAVIRWSNVVSGDTLATFIYKNGSSFKRSQRIAGATSESTMITAIVDADGSADYFEVFLENVTRDTSDIVNGAANTFFMGSRIA